MYSLFSLAPHQVVRAYTNEQSDLNYVPDKEIDPIGLYDSIFPC
jgi:hypothetical protein